MDDDIRPLKDLERDAIVHALTVLHGDKRQAAQRLGLSLKTLYVKLHVYGLPLNYGKRHTPTEMINDGTSR
jgi:DNA-binding NtrC family response regulator